MPSSTSAMPGSQTPDMNRFAHRSLPCCWLAVLILVAAALLGVGGFLMRERLMLDLTNVTGEEQLLPQIKALTDLVADALRPPLNLAPDAPVRDADVNPFGVNVFLNEEVDPAKRELTVRLAAEAGFHWLRQEFPWEDIEIHGKGDFEDRRNPQVVSAWDKYDQIVALAEKYHMELIVRISTPPAWTRAAGNDVGSFAPPDNYADFGDFVYTLVSRYRGRIHYYQIWNEPNIYPEWGTYPISPEQYTELLKVGATRARQADPNVTIICGALASTIALQPSAPAPTNSLNDLLFLQRMYAAGAGPYFDIMAMQAYGLWSGPTDRRMQPRVMNYGRPQFVRDLMVANGDADKPIWISEMAWDAVPTDLPDQRFGRVTPEQQGRYATMAYQRAEEEWPWIGVINTWYFKRATDQWFRENKPEAYFRLADPDFTLQPAYYALKDYMTSYKPTLYRGTHAPDAWAVQTSGRWDTVDAPQAPFGHLWQSARPGSRLEFSFTGTDLGLDLRCSGPAPCGSVSVTVDGGAPLTVQPGTDPAGARGLFSRLLSAPAVAGAPVARGLATGTHTVVIAVADAPSGAPPGIAALYVK